MVLTAHPPCRSGQYAVSRAFNQRLKSLWITVMRCTLSTAGFAAEASQVDGMDEEVPASVVSEQPRSQ